jgi:PAS domain S-box-containing protein
MIAGPKRAYKKRPGLATGPSACILISAEGQVLQINPAHQRLFGYAAQDIVGLNIRDYVKSGSFLEEILVCLERLRLDPATRQTGIYQNFTSENRPITCRWTSTALRDADGNFSGLIGMAEDITEQVVAERALRHSEERYRTITEISPVGIFRTDLEGLTVFVNWRCADIFGMSVEACLGLGWVGAIHAEDAPVVGRAWQDYIESRGSTHYAPEARVVRPDGSIVWALVQVAREVDLAGNLQGHIGTITDITALKTAQLELRQALEHLEERVIERTHQLELAKDAAEHSDRVKSAFLSTMSHELRTPLNSILGFTDVLLQGLSGPLNDAQRKQLQIVRDSSSHLRSLIEDVLDISRIEAGQIGLEFTDVDLGDLIARRVEAFGPEAARKGIELRVGAHTPLPMIRSDRKRAGQIVNNLLSNALKFTDQGSVAIDMRASNERLEIAVTDTGVGIPADSLPLLFNPFTQVIRPGGRMHEGTGLGLAISRNLARALGGDVTVTSEAGRGSCFTFWLPLVADLRDEASASGTFRRPDIRSVVRAV